MLQIASGTICIKFKGLVKIFIYFWFTRMFIGTANEPLDNDVTHHIKYLYKII